MDEQRVLSIPLFAGLSKQERQTIAQHADELSFEEGRHLVREGEFPYEFFILEEGSAKVTHQGEHLAELGPGDFFGEMALVDRTIRNASVVATSPITVVVMTGQAFRQMKRELPAVCERITRRGRGARSFDSARVGLTGVIPSSTTSVPRSRLLPDRGEQSGRGGCGRSVARRGLLPVDRRLVRSHQTSATHFHADFDAATWSCATARATVYLGRQRSKFVRDEVRPRLGPLAGTSSPGYRRSSALEPRRRSATARVLTGDTLFIGDVGRPDLRASLGWSAEELGSRLYDSLRDKLLPLPDETLVYPAHGAGSLCGKNLSTDTVSTIGAQRRDNYALQPMSRAQFVRIVTADQPETPPYFTYDAVLNAKEHPTLEEALEAELQPLSLAQVLELRQEGGAILDTRDPVDFETAHLAGSLNVGLSGGRTVRSDPGGTGAVFTYAIDLQPKGGMRLLKPFLAPMVRSGLKKDLHKLRELLDGA